MALKMFPTAAEEVIDEKADCTQVAPKDSQNAVHDFPP
jgi:hypothetical protein